MPSKSAGKQMKWSENGHKARKIVRKKLQSRLVRMRSAVQIRPAAPKILENFGFRGFFAANSCFAVWVKKSDPHRDPRRHKFQITRFTLAGKARSFHCASVSKRDPLCWARVWPKDHRTGRSAFPPGFLLPFTLLYDLTYWSASCEMRTSFFSQIRPLS